MAKGVKRKLKYRYELIATYQDVDGTLSDYAPFITYGRELFYMDATSKDTAKRLVKRLNKMRKQLKKVGR